MKYFLSITIVLAAIVIFTLRKQHALTAQGTDSPAGTQLAAPKNRPQSGPVATKNNKNRQVASVTPRTPEQALLSNLIQVTHKIGQKPELKKQMTELSAAFNKLPNKQEVLWDYYQELQEQNAPAFDRVEALDMLDGSQPDARLAEVALAEALDFAPPAVIRPEQAKTQEELNESLSTDSEFIPVLVAFDIYLKNCGAYPLCQKGLLTVIANNTNHNMRASLISAVNQRFPNQSAVFNGDLVRYRLNN